MVKGATPGAFGHGGRAPSWSDRSYGPSHRSSGSSSSGGTSSPSSSSSLNVGDVIQITSAEVSQSGNDLTKRLDGGNRVFIRTERGMAAGWSGYVRIISQNPNKPYLYTAMRCEAPTDAVPASRASTPAQPARPSATIDSRVAGASATPSARTSYQASSVSTGSRPAGTSTPAPTYPAKGTAASPDKSADTPAGSEKPTTYTFTIGNVGAMGDQKAVVTATLDGSYLSRPMKDVVVYAIQNGNPTTPQSRSILDAVRAHLKSGREFYEVGGEMLDSSMTFRDYLDMQSGTSLDVMVGEEGKEETVTPPSAVEVLPAEKPAASTTAPASATTVPRRSYSSSRPVDVGVGSRRGGGNNGNYLPRSLPLDDITIGYR